RQRGIPSRDEKSLPQFGHPSSPRMARVLDNNPIRAKPSELFDPLKPRRFPATDMSWQGKPAVTIKPSSKHSDAERVDLAEADRLPSDFSSRESKAADTAE